MGTYELDDHARYGLAGEFVRLIEPHSESDPVALFDQFLVMYGNAIGRSVFHLIPIPRRAGIPVQPSQGHSRRSVAATQRGMGKPVFLQ